MPYPPRVYQITPVARSVLFEPDPGVAGEYAAQRGVVVEKCLRTDVDSLPQQRKGQAEAAWARIPETPDAKRKRDGGAVRPLK